MVLPTSAKEGVSGAYVWAHPGCPIRIHIAFDVIEQLRAEIKATSPAKSEIGGLLVASKRSNPKTLTIVDFVPLPEGSNASGPRFELPSEWLAEVVARCPSDSRVVGYFRTDRDRNIRLRPDELEAIPRCFPNDLSVFLVIAADPSPTAGFFFHENGRLAANPGLTFPFSADKLMSGGWPTQTDVAAKDERFARLREQIGGIMRSGNVLVTAGVLCGITALLFGLGSLPPIRSANPSSTAPAVLLGLQVKRDGTKFLISWNPSAPAIAKSEVAGLVIWDETRKTLDGSSPPLFRPLSPSQLRLGSATYTSFSFVEKVTFRLDATDASGNSVSESVASISPAPQGGARVPLQEAGDRPFTGSLGPPPSARQRSEPAFENSKSSAGKPAQYAALHPDTIRSAPLANQTFMPAQSETSSNVTPVEVAARNAAPVVVLPDQQTIPPRLPSTTGASSEPTLSKLGPPQSERSSAGVVTITSEPSGAKVEINSVPAGNTPVTLQLAPLGLGFTVTVTKNGFAKWVVQSFSMAQPYALHAKLAPASK